MIDKEEIKPEENNTEETVVSVLPSDDMAKYVCKPSEEIESIRNDITSLKDTMRSILDKMRD